MAEATRPNGAGSVDEVRRAFDAAVDGAEKALEAILAEVAELDRRRDALISDAEDLARRITSLRPDAPVPDIPGRSGDAAGPPRPERSRTRRAASERTSRARRAGGAGTPRPERAVAEPGGTGRVLELLGRRPMSLGELGEELGVSATRVQQLMKPLREGGRVVSRPDPDSARRRRLWSPA